MAEMRTCYFLVSSFSLVELAHTALQTDGHEP